MSGDHSEDRVTVWMSSELTEQLDNSLQYGDSRSQWVREAVQHRIALEDALGRRGIDLPDDDAERTAMLEDIATAGVATFATQSDE